MKSKKNNENQSQPDGGSWMFVLQTILTSVISRLGDSVALKIDILKKSAKKKAVGSLLTFIGSIFFLLSAAMFINWALGYRWPWAGYGVVGMVIFIAGWITLKKSN